MLREYWACALAIAGVSAAFLLQNFIWAYGSLIDFTTDASAGVAFISAGLAMSRYGKGFRTRSGKLWPAFTVGILLWFVGEVVWSFYYQVLSVQVPYPSLSDVFYIAGYFPFFAGLSLYVFYFKGVLKRSTLAIVAAVVFAAAAATAYILVPPVLAEDSGIVTKAFDFAYPLLDLVLLSVSLLGLSVLASGALGRPWLFITMGIILNAAGDLLFSYMTAVGTYMIGTLPDLFYILGYISLALAFQLHRKQL